MLPSEPIAGSRGHSPISPHQAGPRGGYQQAGQGGAAPSLADPWDPRGDVTQTLFASDGALRPTTPRNDSGSPAEQGYLPRSLGGLTPRRGQDLSQSGRSIPSNMNPIAIASVRGQINDNILALVRREVEQAEIRLKAEIARLRDTLVLTLEKYENKSDKVTAVINQKMVNHESAQTKLEQTVSALGGCVQGLSGVVQEQIQRGHGVDSRIWEMRHQLEELFIRRCGELDKLQQEGHAKWRASHQTMEDLHKSHHQNLRRLEETVQELAGSLKHQATALSAAHERLAQAEETTEHALQAARNAHATSNVRSAQHAQELAAVAASQSEDGDARLWQAEQQLQEIDQRLNQLTHQAHGDKGWESTMKQHEVKLNSMRAKLDSLEEHCQSFDDRVRTRGDLEQRIAQLQRSYQEIAHRSYDESAKTDALVSRLEGVEQCFDELRREGLMAGSLQAMLESLAGYPVDIMPLEPNFGSMRGQQPDTRDLAQSIQRRIDSIQDASSATGVDGQQMALQQNLDILIQRLAEVVPKILEHDNILKSLPRDLALPDGSAVAAAQHAAEAAVRAAEEAKAIANEVLEAQRTPREVAAVLPEQAKIRLMKDCSRQILDSLVRPGAPERRELEKMMAEVATSAVPAALCRQSATREPGSSTGISFPDGRMSDGLSATDVAEVEKEVQSHLQLYQDAVQKLQEAVDSIGAQLNELRGAVDSILAEPYPPGEPRHYRLQLKTWRRAAR